MCNLHYVLNFVIASVIQTILVILNSFCDEKANKGPNILPCYKIYIPTSLSYTHTYNTSSYTMHTCTQALQPLSTSDVIIPAECYM